MALTLRKINQLLKEEEEAEKLRQKSTGGGYFKTLSDRLDAISASSGGAHKVKYDEYLSPEGSVGVKTTPAGQSSTGDIVPLSVSTPKEKSSYREMLDRLDELSGKTTQRSIELPAERSLSKFYDSPTLEDRLLSSAVAEPVKTKSGLNVPKQANSFAQQMQEKDRKITEKFKPMSNTLTQFGAGLAQGLAEIGDLIVSNVVSQSAMQNALINSSITGEKLSGKDFVKIKKEAYNEYLTSGKSISDRLNADLYELQDDYKTSASRIETIIGDIARTVGQQVPRMAINALTGGTGGYLTMFMTAAQQGQAEALKFGADEGTAFAYGVLKGTIEAVGEAAIGNVLGIEAGLFDDYIIKAAERISAPVLQTLTKWGIKALGEGAEEIIQGALDVAAKRMTYDKNAEIDWAELGYEGLIGSLVGGLFGAANVASDFSAAALQQEYKARLDELSAIAEKNGQKESFLRALENTYDTVGEGPYAAAVRQVAKQYGIKSYYQRLSDRLDSMTPAGARYKIEDTDVKATDVTSPVDLEAVNKTLAGAAEIVQGQPVGEPEGAVAKTEGNKVTLFREPSMRDIAHELGHVAASIDPSLVPDAVVAMAKSEEGRLVLEEQQVRDAVKRGMGEEVNSDLSYEEALAIFLERAGENGEILIELEKNNPGILDRMSRALRRLVQSIRDRLKNKGIKIGERYSRLKAAEAALNVVEAVRKTTGAQRTVITEEALSQADIDKQALADALFSTDTESETDGEAKSRYPDLDMRILHELNDIKRAREAAEKLSQRRRDSAETKIRQLAEEAGVDQAEISSYIEWLDNFSGAERAARVRDMIRRLNRQIKQNKIEAEWDAVNAERERMVSEIRRDYARRRAAEEFEQRIKAEPEASAMDADYARAEAQDYASYDSLTEPSGLRDRVYSEPTDDIPTEAELRRWEEYEKYKKSIPLPETPPPEDGEYIPSPEEEAELEALFEQQLREHEEETNIAKAEFIEEQLQEAASKVQLSSPKEEKNLRKRAAEMWDAFYRVAIDQGRAVDEMAKEIGDPYLYPYFNTARAWTQAAVSNIINEQSDINGNRVGESLNDIFSPVMKKGSQYYYDAQLLLYHYHNIDRMRAKNDDKIIEAKRALEEFAEKYPKTAAMTEKQLRIVAQGDGLDAAEATMRLELIEQYNKAMQENKPVFGYRVTAEASEAAIKRILSLHPELEAWAQKVWKYCDNLLEYQVQTGMVSESFAEELRKKYPHYVPTYRTASRTNAETYEMYLSMWRSLGVADAGVAEVFGVKEGTPVDSKEFEDVLAAGPDKAVRAKKQNNAHVARAIGRAVGSEQDLMPLHEALQTRTMRVIREGRKNEFAQRLLNAAMEGKGRKYVLSYEQHVGEMDLDSFNSIGENKSGDNTFSMYRNGKAYDMVLSDSMYDAVKAIDNDSSKWMKGIQSFTAIPRTAVDIIKKLITGYNPMFTIRNFVRDLFDAGLYSRDYKKFFVQYVIGMKEIASNGQWWKRYVNLGGTYNTQFRNQFFDVEESKATLDEGKATTKAIKKYTLDKIESLNQIIEQLPRFAEFMAVAKSKADANGVVSHSDLIDAMYASAEVTTNFGRSGSWGRWLNRNFVPFLNPGIQGLSKLVRTLKNSKGLRAKIQLVGRFALFGILPVVANELINGDEDDWEYIEQNIKDTHYLVAIGDGRYFKIPYGRATSLGSIAANRAISAMKGEEIDVISTYKTVASQVFPTSPLDNNIFTAWKETNLFDPNDPGKTWYGSNIESMRMQNYTPSERYDASTDKISKWLGKVTGLSPKKINYLLDQYTGVIGDFALPLLTPQSEQNPFAKAFIVDTVLNNKISDEYYELGNELKYAKNSKEATEEEAAVAAAASRYWNSQNEVISDLHAEIRDIEASGELTDKEKKERVRELYTLLNTFQKNVLDTIGDYMDAVEESYDAKNGDDAVDIAYREANRKMFGAEYALKKYNAAVYENAEEANDNGVSYEDFYNIYFMLKDIKPTAERSAASQKREALAKMNIDEKAKAGYYYTVFASDEQRELWDALGFSDTLTYRLFHSMAEANTAEEARKVLAASGLTKAQQSKYYFSAMASDSQLEKLSQLSERSVSAEVYYEYLMRTLGITGDNKKEQIIEHINDMDIASEDKDTLYLIAAQYSESGLKDTPWHNGSLFVLPQIELPKIELPQIELPQIAPPQIELPQLPDIFGQ